LVFNWTDVAGRLIAHLHREVAARAADDQFAAATGECDATPLEGGLAPVIGAFHLGAIVDETHGVPELIDSNNRITGALITLGE
jgi:hypothetical protein